MTTPEFKITRTFDAPLDLVWKAWTVPAMLAKWFGPKGSNCEVVKHELRVGGVLHSRLQMAGAPPIWGKFTYQEIVLNKKLSWRHSFSDEGGVNLTRHPLSPNWPLELLTTVLFERQGDKTKITLTWVPVNANDVERQTFADAVPGMDQGWGGSFDQLDQFVQSTKTA